MGQNVWIRLYKWDEEFKLYEGVTSSKQKKDAKTYTAQKGEEGKLLIRSI
jgi:hypothetical protein